MRPLGVVLLLFAVQSARSADIAGLAMKDHWVRIGNADFELYSNAGESAARSALEQLERVRGFFAKASPLPLIDEFPARIIVFGSHDQLAQFTPSGGQQAFFVASPKRDFIAMWAAPDQYRFAIHEYVHLIVRHSGLKLPTWLNEGWSEVYSTMRPVGDGVAVGDLVDVRMNALKTEKWLPIETLTSIDSNSEHYRAGDSTGLIFYAESWALTHMLFLAPDYSDRFGKFVMAIHHGRTFDAACQEAYGKSAAAVYADLETYFQRKKMFGRVFKAPLGKAGPAVEAKTIEPFETRLVLTDLLAALGKKAEAEAEYKKLEGEQPNRYEVSDSEGYLALAARDANGARAAFERAFAANDPDPKMCLELAMLEEAAKQPLERATAPLERAVQLKPNYTEALLQLGLIQIAARQYESALQSLLKIDKVGPERATPVYAALAYGYFETGDLARAAKDAATAKQYARSEVESQRLTALLELIDARAKSPFPPQPGEKTQRVEGALRAIECKPAGNRAAFSIGDKILIFELPNPKAIEFDRAGTVSGPLNLTCGAQKPIWMTVEYAPASVMDRASLGVIRKMEF